VSFVVAGANFGPSVSFEPAAFRENIMSEQKDGIGIGILKFIRGVGFCMFFMGIGLVFRGEDMGAAILGGSVGLGIGVCMNLAINKLRKPPRQHDAP
jgi:hypothetical protein